MPDDETLRKMAAYGIPAVIQPGFIHGLGESFIASLGMARARAMIPARRYLDAGVPLAGSSDSSVADYNPFVGIWAAIARRDRRRDRLRSRGSTDPRRGDPALYDRRGIRPPRGGDRGTIAAGKLADFVILGRDPLRCPEAELRAIRPHRTILGGQDVYSS